MTIEWTLEGDRLEVGLAGEFDMPATFEFEQTLDGLLAEHAVQRLVLDLSGVTFLDSSGLGSLLSTLQRTQDLGIAMAISNPSPDVRRVLELTGTATILGD